MRILLAVGALALFGLTQPASAQMCGAPGQQAQGQTQSQGMGGMMCGGMGAAAEDDPMADKPAQPKQRMGGMCPCCRNMAMMRGGQSGGGMQHDMPGMGQPKQ